ncbi:MAG: alpha/beta fold hydrolase [Caulobacterales bacterium]|jgi:pimeloyl-ACP methyl ester carboxylesterase
MKLLALAAWGLGGALLLITLAAALALRPDISRADLAQEYGRPDERMVTLASGVILHIRDAGRRDGPPLILLHGFAGNLCAWDGWTERLGDRYRVISVDWIGHGQTPPPPATANTDPAIVIGELADALGLARFALAGNSMGGAFAWRFAGAQPQRVAALILVDSGGAPTDAAAMQRRFALAANPLVGFLLRWAGGPFVMGFTVRSGFADPSKITPADVRLADRMYRAAGNRGVLLARVRAGFDSRDGLALLAAITAPTLLMHGDQDTLVSLAETEELAAAIKGSRVQRYPALGHVPHQEDTAATAADARAFLAAHGW